MKKQYLGLLISLIVAPYIAATAPVEFVVLVTSYNNEAYYEHNLNSIFSQRSTRPFQTIYVDDGSKDATGRLVDAYKEKHQLDDSQLLVIHNEVNLGSGIANIYNTVHNLIDDHKIVVCIDGDDYASFSGVLERLEKEYADPNVWMTYGRFVVYPSGDIWSLCWGYDEETIKKRSFREDSNVPSHLKTFRAKLFKQIKKEDLLDEDGNFYSKAWDMAMLFPMLEMCAPKDPTQVNHSRFIEDTIMYIYNFENPIGDFRNSGGRQEQIRLDRLIRSKQPYEPLNKLFDLKETSIKKIALSIHTPLSGFTLLAADLEFVIVVPSYNNEKYARRNLESLINQNTEHRYSIIVRNDCSTDNTGQVLDDFKKEHGLSDSFLKIIHNPVRVGAMANMYNTIHEECKDHQIVVLVDGDDVLAHNNVLTRVAQAYKDPNIWLTYGQFLFYPSGPGGRQWGTTFEISRDELMQKEVGEIPFVAQHLRTFKAALFKKIKKEDLMLNGEFYEMNSDMATMIPMHEMCAPQNENAPCHSVFIPEILYLYRWDNPISDHRIGEADFDYTSTGQRSHEKVIRALPPYEPVSSLN